MSGAGGARRLANGGLIERTRPLRFRYGGRVYEGFAGDTLASALLANDVVPMARSFKYHRPRGLIAAGVEEPNVLVQLGRGGRSTPNVRATEVELYEGLEAWPVNCWPSAAFDLAAVNDRFARFIPAGFYYKTFMWPSWRLFERPIRAAAGLGRAPQTPDPDRYEARYAHCDVLVVGAGPAGLAAARAAGLAGARTLLVEQDHALGGGLLYDGGEIDGTSAQAWVASVAADLAALPETRVLTRTTALGYFDHNAITLIERAAGDDAAAGDPARPRARRWQVRAGRVILATGALERPLVFPGNDRPGVMLSRAVRTYAGRFGVLAGRSAVVFTNNDDAYATALTLRAAGASVTLVDVRARPPRDLSEALEAAGGEVLAGAGVVATEGRARLSAARVRDGAGRVRRLVCDLLAVSGGFDPNTHLFGQSGGTLRFDTGSAGFAPGASAQAEASAGAAAGCFGLAAALASGHAAAIAALGGADRTPARPARAVADRVAEPPEPLWVVDAPGKAFVDFQNDVTVDDIRLAAQENFTSVEHLKRYTTLGMATDQGRTSNVNALAILGGLTGRAPGETGVVRPRFPYAPTPLGAFRAAARGPLFRPLRLMPAHERHEAAGAALEDYGGWARPSAYRRGPESAAAAEAREALAVRSAAGLFEGSPLGKIEVAGPDAGLFLDRIYANTMSTLKPGRARYGLMLNELGVVIDDGVAARIGENRFLVCTSSGGAGRIAAWLEEWLQCEWPDLQVVLQTVTTAWGVLTLTGPRARDILGACGASFDLSAEAFPHMALREGEVAGLPARVLRVSYTGEVSYEINVPAARTPQLWDALMAQGAALGLTPVGVEAWLLLRTEKGYLHVGADTDGATTPLDVGFSAAMRKSRDFIGKRSLSLPENQRPDRLQFVGFETPEGEPPLPIGAHVVDTAGQSDGYVTSTGNSPALGRPVALGMLRAGRARHGQVVTLRVGRNGTRRARVTAPGAYDPTGERLHG